MSEDVHKIMDRCIRKFGVTDSYWDANWVLPDGSMFPRFKFDRYGNPDYDRAFEHADVEDCLPARLRRGLKPMDAMNLFMRLTGVIRVNGSYVHAECLAPPLTQDQRDIIAHQSCGGDEGCLWDITKGGHDFEGSNELDPNGFRNMMFAYRRCRVS